MGFLKIVVFPIAFLAFILIFVWPGVLRLKLAYIDPLESSINGKH